MGRMEADYDDLIPDDRDLHPMAMSSRANALKRVETLEAAIRKHRDYRGDDRCWEDDFELYSVLPEGIPEPPIRDTCVELANCVRYIANRRCPITTYVSPEREIERLREIEKKYNALILTFERIVDESKS